MPRIVKAKPPRKPKPKPAVSVVKARSPAQIKRSKLLEVRRERGY